MHTGQQRASSAVVQTEKTVEALDSIASYIKQIAEMASHISFSIEQQQTAEEVGQMTAAIDETAEQSVTHAQELGIVRENLSGILEELQHVKKVVVLFSALLAASKGMLLVMNSTIRSAGKAPHK